MGRDRVVYGEKSQSRNGARRLIAAKKKKRETEWREPKGEVKNCTGESKWKKKQIRLDQRIRDEKTNWAQNGARKDWLQKAQ